MPVVTLAQQKADDLKAFYKKVQSTSILTFEYVVTFFFQVYEVYPYLQNYANNWAVADFLHVHLKNKTQALKKNK